MTYHPTLRPEPTPGDELERTIGMWGYEGHALLARLNVGIVGLGSVGSMVCDALARMGFEHLTLIDYDSIERRNLDRICVATRRDIGRRKVDVAADYAQHVSTAERLQVDRIAASVVEEEGYRAALDCDVLFGCVDLPWPRRVLNHTAYAHVIPVINGGINVRLLGERLIGADWHTQTVAPGRQCLECWQAYDPALVGTEREGLLDDPSYISQLNPDHALRRHENVYPFSMHLAGLEVLQMTAMATGPIRNLGDQNYHFTTGNLERTEDQGCKETCPFPLLIATGDILTPGVIGMDYGAEKVRKCYKKG